MEEIGVIFKTIYNMYKRALIVGIIGVFFVIFFGICIIGNIRYESNKIRISINDKEINYYFKEKYTNWFVKMDEEDHYGNGDSNIIASSNNIKLYLTESLYEKGDIRIQIKRLNKILYDGKLINDLSKYVNEDGRYYIQIYDTKKLGFLKKLRTHITFNFIVGNGNHIEKSYDYNFKSIDEENYYGMIVNTTYERNPELYQFNNDNIFITKIENLRTKHFHFPLMFTEDLDECAGILIIKKDNDNKLYVDSSHVCEMIDY